LNASPDTIRRAHDAAASVGTQGRSDVARKSRESFASEQISPAARPSFLGALAFSCTTFADIASILVMVPLVLFTGPTQTDTAYSIALPVAIMALAPFLACAAAKLVSAQNLSTLTLLAGGARLALVSFLFAGLGSPETTGSLITINLAILWGLRLHDATTSAYERFSSGRLLLSVVPLAATVTVLKLYAEAQPILMQSAPLLYACGLIFLFIDIVLQRLRTTGNTRIESDWDGGSGGQAPAKSISTIAYEVVLSSLAGVMVVAPILLLLTDQALPGLCLRADVTVSTSGFLTGALGAVFLERKRPLRLHRLHILFTVALGALLASRTSPLALSALFIACMIAGAVSVSIRNNAWQKAIFLSALVVASALSYIYLLPVQSSWMPIHALRTLVGILFVVAATAALSWTRSRVTVFRLVAHLIPMKNRILKPEDKQ
jgi:hypothetical protein